MGLDELVSSAFLVLCRVGGCLMVLPGLSSARLPMRIRLMLALVLTAVIAPLVDAQGGDSDRSLYGVALAITSEIAVGAFLGLGPRLLVEAAEFVAAAISNYIGLSGIAGSVLGGEPLPALANLITAFAVLLLMISDLPHHAVVGLVNSYAVFKKGALPDSGYMLHGYVRMASELFLLGLRIGAPFLAYALVVNLAFGIIGRLIPQIPSFFISGPFVAMGGLFLLYLASRSTADLLFEMLDAAIARP